MCLRESSSGNSKGPYRTLHWLSIASLQKASASRFMRLGTHRTEGASRRGKQLPAASAPASKSKVSTSG
eukprot:13773083-Alexandrium_andersonii.AAC.1